MTSTLKSPILGRERATVPVAAVALLHIDPALLARLVIAGFPIAGMTEGMTDETTLIPTFL